jgi:UPF0755 protein
VGKRKVVGPLGWISILLIIIFLLVVASISSAIIWYKTSLKAPGTNKEETFVVKKGDTVEEIAQNLEEMGLIKNAVAFRIYLFSQKIDEDIEAGSFRLSSNQTAQELAESLQKGQLDKWVTVIEGLRVEEIGENLVKEFDIQKEKFIKLAKEGYMFPDTYLIPIEASEEKIVSVLRGNFDTKVDDMIKNRAKKNGLTTNQLIILASIVERESNNSEERPVIAGILLKRFTEGIPLAADATIQYSLGYQKKEKTWWKKDLTIQDLEVGGPYNTRKVVGLPPTPICNPGLTSIEAAASPTDSPYYFYIHDPDGDVHFAETLEEHNSNIAKYLN